MFSWLCLSSTSRQINQSTDKGKERGRETSSTRSLLQVSLVRRAIEKSRFRKLHACAQERLSEMLKPEEGNQVGLVERKSYFHKKYIFRVFLVGASHNNEA